MSGAARDFTAGCIRFRRHKWTARALLAVVALFGLAQIASAQTAFYEAPESMLAGAPGTVVRHEPMTGAPLGASTYRVLYRSTGLNGRPIFVSGVVIVPQGAPPPGG